MLVQVGKYPWALNWKNFCWIKCGRISVGPSGRISVGSSEGELLSAQVGKFLLVQVGDLLLVQVRESFCRFSLHMAFRAAFL